jgi:hypothetical protein
VNTFGETLRRLRQMTRDPEKSNRSLSQARLGVLIGHTMDDRGVTGAAVSEWERGKSRINAEDRKVLIALVKVLYKCGGIKTYRDANELLEAGNYRALNMKEIQAVFGTIPMESGAELPSYEERSSKPFIFLVLERLFSLSDAELQNLLDDAEKGPPPSWPRVLAAFMRKTSERVSVSPKTVFWIGIWGIAWWLIAPSMRWPFENRVAALEAIGMYVVGSLIVPLLIGMLIDTKHNEYWERRGLARSISLRLYTYQGAGIGFNLGYFFILPLVLLRHYLNLSPSIWLEITAVTLGLILGNMSARVVPHNLWLVYHRLRFADGAIFFIVALIGPLWGIFFLEYYEVLLTPLWGSAVILTALLLSILIAVQQSKQTDTKQAQP